MQDDLVDFLEFPQEIYEIPMHYRDNLYQVEEFAEGFQVRYMKTSTLTTSKIALPFSTEIVVLRPEGAFRYE